MESYLSEEVRQGIRKAETEALRKKNRLRVQSGDTILPILRSWDGGFATAAEDATHLRGRVDIYDGSRHLYQCLVIYSAQEGEEMVYEYKQQTTAEDRRIVDYDRPDDSPVGLLR